MQEKLSELKARLQDVVDLGSISNLLGWDMSTYMPPGGSAGRSRHLSLLQRLAHQHFTDPSIGRLLDAVQPYIETLPSDHDDAALVRLIRREYERAVRIPSALNAEIAAHAAETYHLWTEARPANDFAKVRPALEKGLDLSRRFADCFPGYESIIDPLIDGSDFGMKGSSVRAVFAQLREQLVPLVRAITEQPEVDEGAVKQHFPEALQKAFGEKVIRDFGYDFQRGRQDKTHHPFMTSFGHGDIRITTRFNEHDLTDGLFSTLHESGHAMYEQGISEAYEGTFLHNGASSGVHESQSRLWENFVGRSLRFWSHYYPELQAVFPEQLSGVSVETFYRAINKVMPSLIRTDADEVTYNLHVMLRFDLEVDLLEGRLAVKDLPEAWNTRYQQDLGVTPPNDRNGVLQDVHWYNGLIGGAFQGYTLGNIMCAQFYDAALRQHPQIPDEIAQGQFSTLLDWLRTNIHAPGAKFTPDELLMRVTGESLNIAPFMRYLTSKYGDLYHLS